MLIFKTIHRETLHKNFSEGGTECIVCSPIVFVGYLLSMLNM
jgi:hypothetical protein